MHIHVDDRFIFLQFSTVDERLIMREAFTFSDASQAYRKGKFDKTKIKKVCFLKKKKQYYVAYSGFLRNIIIVAKKNNIPIETFEDKRTRFEHHNASYDYNDIKNVLPDFDYVDHQIAALSILVKKNIGIIKSPTSSGKTEMFIALLKLTKLPTLIVVNRVTLAIQIYNRILKNGIKDVGLFHGKSSIPGRITVATIGSIKKIPNLDMFLMLILDEVHRAQANTYQEFLEHTSYPIRFGFSATPNSGDKYKWAKIRQFMGDIIYEIDTEKLIEKNVLANPEIAFVSVFNQPTLDWPSANRKCIIENKERNLKIVDIVNKHNASTLILIRNIDHGELLEEMIPGSQFISGEDDAEARQDLIDRFEANDIQVIISSNIFNEGISIDNIQVLIIASGGKSRIETVQKLGRSLRSMGGNKKTVFVYDFDDYGNYFTENHYALRKKIYKDNGFKVI